MNGVKYDQEKPRWSLLPWDVLEWVVSDFFCEVILLVSDV